MPHYRQELADGDTGWSRWIRPIMDGYRSACCDCGLVHDMQFRIDPIDNRVEFRVSRNPRATGQMRRRRTPNV